MNVSLRTIAVQWLRIGTLGFGGPPAHIAMLQRLVVRKRRWLTDEDFADAIAACNLLPGPASTQLAIYCAWRLRGAAGAIVGGLGFILPGLVAILALSALLLREDPNPYLIGAAAGAGAAVAAVAVDAAASLVPAAWRRAGPQWTARSRWLAYAAAGAAATALIGAWVALVLVVAGLVEMAVRTPPRAARRFSTMAFALPALSGLGAVAWVALKVGALSYGGGFVIIPLMQSDAVDRYHWLTGPEFLYAVALGQVTPGPVVHTVAVVGYAAAGLGGGLLAAAVAFAPSFIFILAGARRFDLLRTNASVQAFLTGAAPAAIGAIGGSAIVLAMALTETWEYAVLAAAAVWLLALRRGVVSTLLGAAAIGVIVTAVF